MGRPTKRTPENAERICELIAEGRSLRQIEKVEGLPKMQTILDWLKDDPEFSGQYTMAREFQLHFICDEIVDEARSLTEEEIAQLTTQQINARLNVMKLKIRVLKWWAGIVAPKKYRRSV